MLARPLVSQAAGKQMEIDLRKQGIDDYQGAAQQALGEPRAINWGGERGE